MNKNSFTVLTAVVAGIFSSVVAPANAQSSTNQLPSGIQQATKEIPGAKKEVTDANTKFKAAETALSQAKREASTLNNQASAAEKKSNDDASRAARLQKIASADLLAQTKAEDALKNALNPTPTQLQNLQTAAEKAKTKTETSVKNAQEAAKTAEDSKAIAINTRDLANAANQKVSAAETTLNQAKTDAIAAAEKLKTIETAAKWGDWTAKTSGVQDKSTDKSGFQTLIPDLQKYVQKERLELTDAPLFKLDPSKLWLRQDHNVRVWFINEGASFRNQLAYEGFRRSNYSKGLIFDDVSCNNANGANKACQMGSADGVLDIGDYVDIGKVEAGTRLNFLLKSNGANNAGGDIYGGNETLNPDGLQHMVAYGFGNYLLLGFEDLFGEKGATGGKNQKSDRDFNDTVFVVDMGGRGNYKSAAVPEPSTAIALLGVGALSHNMLRRRKRSV